MKKGSELDVPEKTIRAGALNAMGLIDEILHYVVGLYRAQVQPRVFNEALLAELERRSGQAALCKSPGPFLRRFSGPQPVYQEQVPLEEYLLGTSQGIANREIVLEEMLLLWLANANPAFSPFRELFDDSGLDRETAYPQLIAAAERVLFAPAAFRPGQTRA